MEELGFSLFSQINYTNKDIEIIYTPNLNISSYTYTIVKDDNIYFNSTALFDSTTILLKESGSYQIYVFEVDNDGNNNEYKSGIYNIDKEAPVIDIKNNELTIKKNDTSNLLDGVSAYDNVDGDLTSNITTNAESLQLNKSGNKILTYTVSDKSGNTTQTSIEITVLNNSYPTYIATGMFSIIIIFVILILMKFKRMIKIEKRLSKYSVKPLYDRTNSIFDIIDIFNNKIINNVTRILEKSEIITKRSKRYQKYEDIIKDDDKSLVRFITKKILVGFLFIIIAVITKIARLEVFHIYEMIIPFIVGYFITDLYYAYQYRVYRHMIENTLLQAITLMNNAFKSGRSITQAVELVSHELKGPIALEFEKMSREISFGLELETVFERFSERIKLEEAVYLTSSLSILNKTGGNIIKVFDSIEKTLYNRKKLNLEMRSLTGSSRIIMYTLMIVPIAFVLFITLINPTYFNPLFTSPIGFIIMGIVLLLYITYIYVVKKIMTIRM